MNKVLSKKQIKLEHAIEVAKSRGGEFLSSNYFNTDYKYKWRCSKGHEWQASYYSVINRGSWCGRCIGTIRDKTDELNKAKNIAIQRGGKCLSKKYISNINHLSWTCDKGHEWPASLSNIKRGKWCPECAGNKVNPSEQIIKAKKYAIERGGKCLSEVYVRVHDKLEWQCSNEHKWIADYGSVVNQGSWCGRCNGTIRDKEKQLDIAKKIAISKNGLCLSNNYINNRTKLAWKCERGHQWEAVYTSVVSGGSWCPTCSSGLSERIIRNIFEQLFKLPFKKQKPSWLINPITERKMELDGYNKDIGIAFEYQGEQHNRIVKPFKMDSDKLESQLFRDDLKKSLCIKHNLLLIQVPNNVKTNEYPYWIYKCIKNSSKWDSVKEIINDYKTIEINEWLESESYSIKDLKKLASAKGGNCLSRTYIGVKEKYKWQCKKGHEWSSSWDSIINVGSWCPICSGNIVDSVLRLNQAISTAKQRGGECLSLEYTRAQDKMRFRCKNGHEWETRWSHVVQGGTWCRKCRETKKS